MTKVIGGRTIEVMAWYDNEYVFSCLILDLASLRDTKGGMKGAPRLELPVQA